MAASKRIQLENLTRDVIHLPVAAGLPDEAHGLFTLGDKADTDDKVPKGRTRDPRYQPDPIRVVSSEQLEQFGPRFGELLADQIAQKRVRRTELAA